MYLEVKSSIYTLHDSFRLEFIKSYNNLVDDLRQNRITQAQFDQKYAELNTAIISHTRDYILFEAQRRINRNGFIISIGLATFSLLFSLGSFYISNKGSAKSEKMYNESLSSIRQIQEEQKIRDVQIVKILNMQLNELQKTKIKEIKK